MVEAETKVVLAGKVLQVATGEIRERQYISISGGRITAVADTLPAGFTEPSLDWSKYTVLPGLIDAHMHFFGVSSRELHKLALETQAYRALRGAHEARLMLLAGITAARDLGSSVTPEIRRAINEGLIPGPRMVASGEFITTTGGTWEVPAIPLEVARKRDIMADGPEEMRAIVRRRIRAGANVIKLGLSKGGLDDDYHEWGDDPLDQLPGMSLDEVLAAVDEAHQHGIKVSAHAIGDESVKLALAGGVDIIEHAYGITEETRARLVESQVLVGSTISQLYSHIDAFDEYNYPEWEQKIFLRHIKQMKIDFEKSLAAGVRYVLGSDLIGYPTHPQDSAAKEYEYAVQWGMTTHQALVSGIKNGAEALGMTDTLGEIEVGKYADFIAVEGNPLDNIALLREPRGVVKDGELVRHLDRTYV